jgi:aspartokinase
MSTTWSVHKFGGTSVTVAGRYPSPAHIIPASRRDGARAALVVSDLLRLASFTGAPR